MKKMTFSLALLLSLVLTGAASDEKNLRVMDDVDLVNAIEGEFIAVFKPTVDPAASEDETIQAISDSAGEVIQQLKDDFGVVTQRHYIVGEQVIMYLTGTREKVGDAVEQIELIQSIEPDRKEGLHTHCFTQLTWSKYMWGLDRIDQPRRVNNPTGEYRYSTKTGEPVYAYVLDTGIYTAHPFFQGRATWGYTTDIWPVGTPPQPDEDNSGHGTHVAGTIGSSEYGVAKDVNLIAVKVLPGDGFRLGSVEGVIDGLHWVLQDHVEKNKKIVGCRPNENSKCRKAVVNMSLGGMGYSYGYEVMINALVDNGVVVVVSAGNAAADSCFYSPAGISNAITVGATTSEDVVLGWSNFGKCVDVYAPGALILSTVIDSDKYNVKSGTSMAAPHVSGVVANYLKTTTDVVTKESIMRWLYKKAVVSKKLKFINCHGHCSINKLIYQPC